MKSIIYKGAVYVAASDKGTDALATWLEEKGVEIDLRYRKPLWELNIQGAHNNVTTSGRSMNAVLIRGCKLFGNVRST